MIERTVQDSTGAAVAGATVVARDPETNLTRTTHSERALNTAQHDVVEQINTGPSSTPPS